jgi:hypothetical protein
MKQINLLEILIKHIPTELYDPSLDKYYLAAMEEACENTVALCAENAKIKDIKIDYTGVRAGGYYILKEVDKESILKVKKQII